MRALLLPASIFIFLAAACSDGDDDNGGNDAGTNNTGDSGNQNPGDGGMNGEDVVPADSGNNNPPQCDPSFGAAPGCGGSPEGTWTYQGACGASSIQDEVMQACASASFQATSHQVTGDLSFTGNTYTVMVTDVADVEMTIPAACAAPLGGCQGVATTLTNQLGSPTTCTQTGADCSCDSRVTAVVSQVGTFTTANGVITTTPSQGAGASYNYCVENGVLRYREQGDTVVYVLTP